MNRRIGRVRIISEDTYQAMKSQITRLESQHDSFCAEIEAGHQLELAAEFLAPYEQSLKDDGENYPLPHEYVTDGDIQYLKSLNVRF